MKSQFPGRWSGWLLAVVAVMSIGAGAGITAGVYETQKASNRAQFALFEDDLIAPAEEQVDAYEACGDHVRVLAEATSAIIDADSAKDEAINAFFTKYDYYAGDAAHLYDELDQQNQNIQDVLDGVPATPC